MTSRCANPECGYWRDGRVFLFDRSNIASPGEQPSDLLEHYWLCDCCASHMTLVHDGSGVHLISRSAAALETSDASLRHAHPWPPE